MRSKGLWLLAKRTAQKYSADNCSEMAAAISYYVLLSVVPLTIVLASIFGFVVRNGDIRQNVVGRVVAETPLGGEEGERFVSDTVQGVSRVSAALSIVGVLGMAWSASAMAGAVRRSLNVVWDVPPGRPIALIDLGLVLGLGLLLSASIAGTAALHTLRQLSNDVAGPVSGDSVIWAVPSLVVPAVLTYVDFLLICRFVPAVRHDVRAIWPGALLATLLFELLKNGFAIYVAHFNTYDVVYGSLGAIMLFLLWTYLASSILLLGAELEVEYGRLRRGEYAAALAQPGGRPVDAILRAARGLFFREGTHR